MYKLKRRNVILCGITYEVFYNLQLLIQSIFCSIPKIEF